MKIRPRKFYSIPPHSIQYLIPLHCFFTENMTDDFDQDLEGYYYILKIMVIDNNEYQVPFYWNESEYLKNILRESVQKKND